MKDAVTIVVVHISRQQGQPLVDVGQDFRLKAGANFLQRINEAGHFVGSDPPVQRKPIEPGHLPAHPGKRVQGDRITGGSTSTFGWLVNGMGPVHWGVNPV